MATYVYATATCSAAVNGQTFRLVEGDVWDASHPLVKSRPSLFAQSPTRVNGRPTPIIEAADARPGEKRGARRG